MELKPSRLSLPEYSPDQLDKLRRIGTKAVGLIAVGSAVCYAWKNNQVRAHVYRTIGASKGLWVTLINREGEQDSMFSGEVITDESGEVTSVEPDPNGNLTDGQIDTLTTLFVDEPAPQE